MANPTTNYGWPMPTSTDLVTDLPADFALFGQPVDTSLKALNPETTLGDIAYRSSTSNTNTRLGIGTNGQVLAVASGVPAWTTTADVTPLTTKGDLFTFTTVDARIGVGANNTVLTADSAEASGLKWATPTSTTAAFVGAIAYGAVNLAWGNTDTIVSSLTTEIVDTDAFHSTSSNTGRMTIPSGKDGKYFMAMDMNLAATGGSSPNMFIKAYKNGSAITEGLTAGKLGSFLSAQGQDAHWNVSLTVTGVATDYFEFVVIMGGGSSTIDKARYTFTYLGA